MTEEQNVPRCNEWVTTPIVWGFTRPITGTSTRVCCEPAPYADGKCAKHTKEQTHG